MRIIIVLSGSQKEDNSRLCPRKEVKKDRAGTGAELRITLGAKSFGVDSLTFFWPGMMRFEVGRESWQWS